MTSIRVLSKSALMAFPISSGNHSLKYTTTANMTSRRFLPPIHSALRMQSDTGRRDAAIYRQYGVNSQTGFTLIELLVVLAIVALLLTLAVPRFFQRIDTAKETILAENLRATRETIDKYFSDTGHYPDSLDELVKKHYLRALPVDPITERDDSWTLDAPEDASKGKIYDLHSGASGTGKNGKPYAQW